MEMGRVLNLRNKGVGVPYGAMLVDRTTQFGNPFKIPEDGDRQGVVDRYEKYLIERAIGDSDFADAVKGLAGKDLVCWCAPLACHADVLVRHSYNWVVLEK